MGGMEPIGATGVPSPFCPLSLRVCWLRIPSLSGNSDAHQYPSILLYVCQAACSFTLIHPLIFCHIHNDFQKSTRTSCPPLNSLSPFLFSLVNFFFPLLYSHQNRVFRGKRRQHMFHIYCMPKDCYLWTVFLCHYVLWSEDHNGEAKGCKTI